VRKLARFICLLLPLAFAGCDRVPKKDLQEAADLTNGGNARVGRIKIRQYGCNACHEIAGVPGAHGLVGPPLTGVRERYYIAGELANSPDNLMRWIQHPHQVEPHTAMPEMGVSEQDSRDIAAYLYTLR
jgi:cytochrome c2